MKIHKTYTTHTDGVHVRNFKELRPMENCETCDELTAHAIIIDGAAYCARHAFRAEVVTANS